LAAFEPPAEIPSKARDLLLSAGTKLGSYIISGAIGAGGMGEVYQAHDSKLGRDVAIKVLPEAFARDPERLSRFQREAKTLASLNHPNIAHIYGLEENAGSSYLVMELVPGDTLADRIKRDGAFSIVETLAIAKQMAEALEAAHEKGIVHRDLKPANVKVTPDGKVKVLDFGLAKAFSDDGSSQDIANSPTMSGAATMQGVILGTAAYMSPEQARGKQVDRRADIWAFGVVLYEMITGDQLFAGETVSDTLAAVLRQEPDWSKVPARAQRLLRSCLEKDPKKRLRDIGDMDLLLQENSDQTEQPQNKTSSPWWLWAITAAACLVAGGPAVIHFREKPPAAPEVMSFKIKLPDKVEFTRSAHISLSPDGHTVAFPAVGPDGHNGVWVQALDAEEARELPGTDPTVDTPPFFWSPDSRFIVFDSSTKLRKVGVSGEPPQDLCDRPSLAAPVGGSWNRDGIIIFGTTATGLWKIPSTGGTPAPLTVLDASRHEREHELPVFLPDGRHFIYFRNSTVPDVAGIYVGSLDDPPERQSEKRVLATGFGGDSVSSEDGNSVRLLFLLNGNLMAQSFDLGKLSVTGEPSPIVESIDTAYETAHFSATPNVLVYREKTPEVGFQLTWFDDQGKIIGKVGDPASYITTVRISPDGTRVAFAKGVNSSSNDDLWLLDFARGTSTRFTFGPGKNEYPVWSPDGKEIVFSSTRNGVYDLYRKPSDGSKAEQLLSRSSEDKRGSSWSRDGRFLAYGSSRNVGPEQAWTVPIHGDPTPIPLFTGGFNSTRVEFSPDGRWIAYESNETGKFEVYVREFTGSADSAASSGKWMISNDGGFWPHWRADGKEIVYAAGNQTTLMSVDVDTSHSFQAGTPRMLFDMPVDRSGANVPGVTSDLKQFLLSVPVEHKAAQSFTVMLNWTSAVKK
jgi:eukaryotic-like serine/threonine-protein kinase